MLLESETKPSTNGLRATGIQLQKGGFAAVSHLEVHPQPLPPPAPRIGPHLIQGYDPDGPRPAAFSQAGSVLLERPFYGIFIGIF